MPRDAGGPSRVRPNVRLAVVAAFSALMAVGTFFGIPVPQPLGEITWAPPIYMALSVLTDTGTAFTATAIGSFIGEMFGVFGKGFPPIYALGIVWARAPETVIIGRARRGGRRILILAMVGATVFETLAFFFPDWFFYTYGLFQYGSPTTLAQGFIYASFDFGTLVDLAFIPIALLLIKAAKPAFERLGFA